MRWGGPYYARHATPDCGDAGVARRTPSGGVRARRARLRGSRGRRGARRQRLHLRLRRAAVDRGGRDRRRPGREPRLRRRLQPRRSARHRGVPGLRQRRRRRPARRAAPPGRGARRRRRAGHRLGPALRRARRDQLRRQPGPLHRAVLGGRPGPARDGVRRAAGGRLRVRRHDGLPARPLRVTRRVLRADVRLLRGHRAQPALVAARVEGGLRAGGGLAAPLRVLAQPAEVLPARAQPAVHGAHGVRPAAAVRRVPPLLALELATLAIALRDGWARQKLAGWWWLLRHCRPGVVAAPPGAIRAGGQRPRAGPRADRRPRHRRAGTDRARCWPGVRRGDTGPSHAGWRDPNAKERCANPRSVGALRRRGGHHAQRSAGRRARRALRRRRIWSFWSQRDTEAGEAAGQRYGGLAEAAGEVPRRQHPAHHAQPRRRRRPLRRGADLRKLHRADQRRQRPGRRAQHRQVGSDADDVRHPQRQAGDAPPRLGRDA